MKKINSILLVTVAALSLLCGCQTQKSPVIVVPKIETGKLDSIDNTEKKITIKTDTAELTIDVADNGLLNSLNKGDYYIFNIDDNNTLINAATDENAQALNAIMTKPVESYDDITITPITDKSMLNCIKTTQLRLPDVNAVVYLYNNAAKNEKGELLLDDRIQYLLTVEIEGQGEYVLLNENVQLGKIDFVAFESLEDNSSETTVISFNATTANVEIKSFTYNAELKVFEAESVYKTSGNTNVLSVE